MNVEGTEEWSQQYPNVLSGDNSARVKGAVNTTEARDSDRYSDSIGLRYSTHNALARTDTGGSEPPIYRPGSR